jgi:hypothetical protein
MAISPAKRRQPVGSVSKAIKVYPDATGVHKELAEERLFRFLMQPLEVRTRKTLDGYGSAVDPQEAAQSAARSTIANLRERKLPEVATRSELRNVALHKAGNKTAAAERKIYTEKRGNHPRHEQIDDPENPVPVAAPGFTAEQRAILADFIASCPPEQRFVYICRQSGWEIKEIAVMMKVSPRTVNGWAKDLSDRAAEYAQAI